MARTDPGLGPKAEQEEKSGARPAPKGGAEPSVQIAEPPPRTGGADTVDAILEGFGDRPERPRVKVEKRAELTPVPSPEPPKVVQKHVSTSPGQRQRGRRELGYLALTALVLVGVVGFVFYVTRGGPAAPAPAPTVAAPTNEPAATAAPQPTQAIPTIAATALPTSEPTTAPATTARVVPTARPTAKATAAPPATAAPAATTAAAPKPTGSAPPGFNLLKDKGSLE
jgi:hypothetical protein